MKKSVYSILACGAALLLMACDNDVPVQATYSRMPGESCDAINDCDKAFLCIGGICRIPCTTDEGCSKRQNCINNFCANTFDGGCRIGWSGTSCEICADNYYGGNCQPCPVCGEHGKCDDTLTGDGHCQCNTGWEGPACDECANGYGGDECAPCDPIFTGKGCTQCRDPRFSGPRCDECIDGATDTVQGKDGHNYTTICFNKQFWMAENMADNFGRYIPTGHSTANNVNYGLLYSWLSAKAVCPAGWYLPTIEEYQDLLQYIQRNAPEMPLFSADGCSDEVGFCALPAGIYLSPDGLIDFNSTAHFWSSSVKECSNNKECAYSIHIDSNGSFGVNGDMYSAQIGQASVRCAQDSCTDSRFTGKECDRCLDGVTDVMTDKNGTRYKTVCIDGRFWMAENMKYKTDTISCGGSNNESDYFDIYGCLYNGTNANNVCPTDNGWRLPTKQEVDKLFNYAQDNSNIHNAAYALKAKSETWSNAQNNEDTFGFAALPGGDIMQGSQSFVRERGFWWLSNNNYFSISSDNNVTSGSMQGAPGPNLSIRCIKDINE